MFVGSRPVAAFLITYLCLVDLLFSSFLSELPAGQGGERCPGFVPTHPGLFCGAAKPFPRVKHPLNLANKITHSRVLTPKSACPGADYHDILFIRRWTSQSGAPCGGHTLLGTSLGREMGILISVLPAGVTPASPSPLPSSPHAGEFGKVGSAAPRAHPGVQGFPLTSYLELGEGRGISSPGAPAAHPPAAPALPRGSRATAAPVSPCPPGAASARGSSSSWAPQAPAKAGGDAAAVT